MGKYKQPPKPICDDNRLEWVFHDIRNELAEANRLKRLELGQEWELTHGHSGSHGTWFADEDLDKELEDKA